MDSPHIKSSCGTQNKISNPMGIGLGIDYVTWRKILKWIPPTSNLHVGHKIKFSQSYGFPPNQIFMYTKKNFQSYGYRVRN